LVASFAIVAAACGGGGTPSGSPGGGSPGGGSSAGPSGSAGASGLANLGGAVSIYGTWQGAEQDSFFAMIKPWTDATGVKVNYTGQRDLGTAITTGIAGGNLPDVAGLPGPGVMQQWYKDGNLKPLDFVDFASYEAATPKGFAALGKAPDGKLIGIFTKGAVKGLIWYNTKNWTETTPPATLDALEKAAAGKVTGDEKVWCIGFESGGDSGWPGTDWIEDIVLRQSGLDVYNAWVQGKQKWTSTEIKSAFTTFGQILQNAYGGSNYINTTNFGKAANPMFKDPPGCLLHHQASFITDFFKNEAKAQPSDYGFFPFPDINSQFAGSVTGGGDLFGMFNDTPQARSLIQYLLTPQAQEIWVKRGGFISANKNVATSSYPDDASKKSAEILTTAKIFGFDASDQMPNAMTKAFNQAMVKFATNPGDIDTILSNLDQTQTDSYGS
jgi:alpha-glucoside transport system substrate-binding protein